MLSRKLIDTLLTALLLLSSIYFFLINISPGSIFNSDALFLAHLNKGIFQQHQSFKYWSISATNYLFPDGMILFLLSLIFKNFQLAIILTDAVLLLCYYLLMVKVGIQLTGSNNKNIYRLFALISIIFGSFSWGNSYIFSPLFNSHIGVNVIGTLLGWLLIIKLLNKPTVIYYILLGIIVFLNTFSDLLFIVTMVGTGLIGLIGIYRVLEKPERMCVMKISLVLLISGGVGYFTNNYDFFHLNIVHFSLDNLFNFHEIITLYKIFQNFYAENPLLILIVLLFFIFSATCLIKTVLLPGNKTKLKNTIEIGFLFFIMATGLMIAVLIVFELMFDKDLSNPPAPLRHFSAAVLIPVFLGIPLLLVKYGQVSVFVEKYYIYFSIIFLANFLLIPYKRLQPLVNYYPSFSKCLDNYAENGKTIGLNGVSTYWHARINSMLSKNNLNIVAISPEIIPLDWMNTKQDYLNKKFNFIIITQSESSELIKSSIKKYGKPQAILQCPGDNNSRIYVYEKGFSIEK